MLHAPWAARRTRKHARSSVRWCNAPTLSMPKCLVFCIASDLWVLGEGLNPLLMFRVGLSELNCVKPYAV